VSAVLLVGVVRRYLGHSSLVCDRGTLELVGLTKDAERMTGFVKVAGHLTAGSRLEVSSIEHLVAAHPSRLPHYYGGRADMIRQASRLRSAAHRHLASAGCDEVFLPSAWPRTDELDGAEIRLAHESLVEQGLHLQRFPELPAFMALATGLSDWYSFGRCWRAQPEFDTPARDNLLEFEQLTVGRAAWSMTGMLDFATTLVTSIAAAAGHTMSRADFEQRDLRTAPVAVGRFSRNIEVPLSWGPRARQTLVTHLERLGCDYRLVNRAGPSGGLPQDATGADIVLIEGPSEQSSHVDAIIRTVRALESSQDIDDLRTLSLHPTWVVHPPLMLSDDVSGIIGYRARSLTTARTSGPQGTHMVHADLVLGGLEVGHASLYADLADLEANIEEGGGGDVDLGYVVEALECAPPALGVASLGWERLCSVLLGGRDSSEVQPFARLSIGGLAAADVGPK
jgi:hypothetical protein